MQSYKIALLSCCMLLAACGTGFENNYQPVLERPVTQAPLQVCAKTQVEKLSPYADIHQVQKDMEAKGYVLIGKAQWESTSNESSDTALEQGEKVGACLVLWRKIDAGVTHTTRTVSHYTPPRQKTIVVEGSQGKETRVITIPGHTDYYQEPVIYQRYDYLGLFFAKLQGGTSSLGIESAAPSVQYMAKNDSRRGILVVDVAYNSPAYHANIFPGDVLLQLNGQDLTFGTSLSLMPQQDNELRIDRNGQQLVKKISTEAQHSFK